MSEIGCVFGTKSGFILILTLRYCNVQHCQFDKIYTHWRDEPSSMSVDYIDQMNWSRKTHANVGITAHGLPSQSNQEGERELGVFLLFTAPVSGCIVINYHSCYHTLGHSCIPWSCKPNKPLSLSCFVEHFVVSMRWANKEQILLKAMAEQSAECMIKRDSSLKKWNWELNSSTLPSTFKNVSDWCGGWSP